MLDEIFCKYSHFDALHNFDVDCRKNGTEAIYDSTGLKKYVEYTSAFEKLRNYPRSRESPFSCFDLKKALFRSHGWKVPY